MLELKLDIDEVDYESVLQVLSEHLPAAVVMAARALPDSAKESMVATLISNNADKLTQWMEKALESQGIHARISGVSATKVN